MEKLIQLACPGITFLQVANMLFGKFDIDAENKEVIQDMIRYINFDEKFNHKSEFGCNDLNKGILFMGNPGSGKTAILKIIQVLFRQTPFEFKRISTKKVVDNFDEIGPEYLKSIQGNYFFDDLGFETPAMYYGDKRELFQDIIFSRYDQFINSGKITHFTMMINQQEFIAKYGSFAWSRILQMCNIYRLGGSSSYTDRRIGKVNNPNLDYSKLPRLYITESDFELAKQISESKKNARIKIPEKKIPEKTEFKGAGTRLKETIDEILKR